MLKRNKRARVDVSKAVEATATATTTTAAKRLRPKGISSCVPSPSLEAARLRGITEMAKYFQEQAGSAIGGRKWFTHFETWLWSSRMHSSLHNEGAPLPVSVWPFIGGSKIVEEADHDIELLRKLERAGLGSSDARALSGRLVTRARAVRDTAEDGNRGQAESSGVTVSRRTEACPAGTIGPSTLALVELSCGEMTVKCSEAHFSKLRLMYDATQMEKADGGANRDKNFHASVYCVLARILALQGGHEKAGGNQAACPPAVFSCLRSEIGLDAELFASPLNTTILAENEGVRPTFCSAAGDVDAAFGSVGSCFACRPRRGCFFVNPPFVEDVAAACVAHLMSRLKAAQARGAPLTFVVVLPRWPESAAWQALASSSPPPPPSSKSTAATHPESSGSGGGGCRARTTAVTGANGCRTTTLTLLRDAHGYMEGAQHYRAGAWRFPANHDSTVFVLQSPAAVRTKPFTAKMEKHLREAFRTPPPVAAAER